VAPDLARQEGGGEDKVRRGRRKKNLRMGERERGGGENEKKIDGEHITAGSYYNPAVMLIYHRRVHLEPAVKDYHRRFEINRR